VLKNIAFSDLELDGSNADFRSADYCVKWNPALRNGAGGYQDCCEHASALQLADVTDTSVHNVTFHDVLGDAVYFFGQTSNTSVTHSRFARIVRVGINFDSASFSRYADNEFSNVGWALKSEDVGPGAVLSHNIITENIIQPGPCPPTSCGSAFCGVACTTAAINVHTGSNSAGSGHDVVARNRIQLGPEAGIGLLVDTVHDIVIANNHFDMGATNPIGYATTALDLRVVTGAVLAGNIVQRLPEGPAENPFFSPSRMIEQTPTAIGLATTSAAVIRANIVHDSTSAFRVDYPSDTLIFAENHGVGLVPTSSIQTHYGAALFGGEGVLFADNSLRGYDRQIQSDAPDTLPHPAYGATNVCLIGNLLRGIEPGYGRPIPSLANGGAVEAVGLSTGASFSNRTADVVLVENLLSAPAGGPTFLPLRAAFNWPNDPEQVFFGEVGMSSNVNFDAGTRTQVDTSQTPQHYYPELSRTPISMNTVKPARTTSGTATISNASTSVHVTFGSPLPSSSFRVVATVGATVGAVPPAATRIVSVAKTASGFDLTAESAPGAGKQVTFEWMVFP
jgi:hypothetical protein